MRPMLGDILVHVLPEELRRQCDLIDDRRPVALLDPCGEWAWLT
jgi:hypothetical protein